MTILRAEQIILKCSGGNFLKISNIVDCAMDRHLHLMEPVSSCCSLHCSCKSYCRKLFELFKRFKITKYTAFTSVAFCNQLKAELNGLSVFVGMEVRDFEPRTTHYKIFSIPMLRSSPQIFNTCFCLNSLQLDII